MNKRISAVFKSTGLVCVLLTATHALVLADAGTTAGQSLIIGVDARSVGVGEAITALVDDATALQWNPAALHHVQSQSIILTHAPYLDSSSLSEINWGFKANDRHAFGAAVRRFSADDIDQTEDVTGTKIGTFEPTDLIASLGYAFQFARGTSVGITGKYVKSEILDSASTATGDLGLMLPAYKEGRLRLGASARNLGGSLKYDTESDPLPTEFRAGAAYKLTDEWDVSADTGIPRDDDVFFAIGTEFRQKWNETTTTALRAGYNSFLVAEDADGVSGVGLGAGLRLNKLGIDYAMLPFGDLGLTHRITLGFNF